MEKNHISPDLMVTVVSAELYLQEDLVPKLISSTSLDGIKLEPEGGVEDGTGPCSSGLSGEPASGRL